jgi:hypothetical protein
MANEIEGAHEPQGMIANLAGRRLKIVSRIASKMVSRAGLEPATL